MPAFGNVISGVQALRSAMQGAVGDARMLTSETAAARESLDATSKRATDFREHVVKTLDDLKEDATPRIKDLEFDLEHMSDQGNAWATSLLDIVRQVQQGTVNADEAIRSMGDGVILFEGQLRSVKDVLADVLPTTGEVQSKIQELQKTLESADVNDLIERLKGQYNNYAQLLAETAEGFAQGKVTLERVLLLAQQLQQVLPGSETAELAEILKQKLLSGEI